MKVPVSKVCPECGGGIYTKRRPKALIAFVFDRVCSDCGTRYAPPTPTWAAITFILAGLLFATLGFFASISYFVQGDLTKMVYCGSGGIMGLGAAFFGFKSLTNSVKK